MNSTLLRYAITDRTQSFRNGPDFRTVLDVQAGRLAAEGIDFLQLREKDLSAAELVSVARSMMRALHGSKTKLLVNARADVAVAAGAHGVHLISSPGELSARQIHDLYAHANLAAPIVTVSCHSLEDVVRHRLEPVSAILFGPVFEKVVSGAPTGVEGAGLALLQQACRAATPVPVLALGGITAARISVCHEAGAAGVAGIRLFQRL